MIESKLHASASDQGIGQQGSAQEAVDIAIVGAGIVGLTLANLLKDLPLKVALIEAKPIPEWNQSRYDLRVSAISKASESLFKLSGIWDALKERRISPYHDMLIWETELSGQEALEFSSASENLDNLGYIIENNLIRDELHKGLFNATLLDTKSGSVATDNQAKGSRARAKIYTYIPTTLSDVQSSDKQNIITLDTGQKISAKLLIAADGAGSVTRKKLGINTVRRSYSQQGVVAHLTLSKPHLSTAYQRFHGSDILAFLPLENSHEVSMVWSVPNDKAAHLMAMDAASLAQNISECMQGEFGEVALISDVQSFPLSMLHASHYVTERIVLCGDAAHAIHPLAGQGVNIGLLDAKVLSDTLHQAWKDNLDIGDLSVLRRYERKRKSANVRVMATMDMLFNLFQEQTGVLPNVRRFGMGLVNRVGFIKRELLQHALGLR